MSTLPPSELKERIGFIPSSSDISLEEEDKHFREYVNLKFAARGLPIVGNEKDYPFLEMGKSMLQNFQERLRLLKDYRCPADQDINGWIREYLGEDAEGLFGEPEESILPDALSLEKHGIARLLSLPADADEFKSDIVSSFRTWQGVCHNPQKDRRTTKGVFHVTEGGLPIPGDKLAVPKPVFAKLLKAALNPPKELLMVPFTANQPEPIHSWVSLLLRPTVSPEVPGFTRKKSLEVRFFAPGNLVSNLDFVESIFGNAGDPFLPENDARLDVEHWTGHTGCVILAPHLCGMNKKEIGLPHISEATDRQKTDGMCWENESDAYNGGQAFKITARNEKGVIVTLIADNYFGYCKKEVKTQISFSANLYGLVEEEHAGGALVFPSFDLGEDFSLSQYHQIVDHKFAEDVTKYSSFMDLQPQGYAIDRNFKDIIYLPEDAAINMHETEITWELDGNLQKIRLQPNTTYVMPSGYKVEMRKPNEGQRWRLVGTQAEGTFCHKPCTVSGGGKSEISKSLADAMVVGPVIIPQFDEKMFLVENLLKRDYGDRYAEYKDLGRPSRNILDPARSLGSVMRLFTKSEKYTAEYNEFIESIPQEVRDFILTLKRYYKADWAEDWRSRFRVDSINGKPGEMLKYRFDQVNTSYLRVGFAEDSSWRMFGLRKDFSPATKLQREDDITASVTVPASALDKSMMHPDLDFPSYKFTENCEFRLFQRPDDAIHRGYDKQTELDFSGRGLFFSNYEPIDRPEVRDMVGDAIRFGQFTKPLQKTLKAFAKAPLEASPGYAISSSKPRIVENGEFTKNPRYLQNRPDLDNPRSEYLAEVGSRLFRQVPDGKPVLNPVHAVLPGRRNNPADREAGIRPLAVYGPIHYQELPELFMEFIASLTGKSPSTTGAGSEGALTKGPFNALLPITDLNNALMSYVVAGYEGFSTAAGYIGPKYRVDHDISLVVPEIWSRMFIHERDPKTMIESGHLEKIDDFEHNGRKIEAGRLGYRITEKFVEKFFGRMFNDPHTVFVSDMLRPEEQSMVDYVDGIDNIITTQQTVAQRYFDDESIQYACPPLEALLHIMAKGDFHGKTLEDPEVRDLFDRDSIMQSDWYLDRLKAKLSIRVRTLTHHIASLENFLEKKSYQGEANRLNISDRLTVTRELFQSLQDDPDGYIDSIRGSLGADPRFA